MHSWSGVEDPVLYAHRGASAELPENTLPAFRRALELGADVLELDVHPSRDGVFVVSHDPTAERIRGVRHSIAASDWAEIAGWGLERFDQLLEELPTAAFNVDVKLATAPEIARLVELLHSRRAEGRVLLTSFSWRCLRRIRRAGYRGALGLSQLEVVQLRFAPELLLKALPVPGVRVQIPTHSGPIDLSGAAFIERCHRLGLRVDYWVINDPAQAAMLLERGADGIFTDDVAAIAPVFAASPKSVAWRQRHP
ncbi:MAG TPA: glycerophosphodiester phosphodiesterase family protein [Polyangiaceae bacterium]|nr:glycerophosphodiester phosphodiesterase family protein [Polyangiaceae bacterium]